MMYSASLSLMCGVSVARFSLKSGDVLGKVVSGTRDSLRIVAKRAKSVGSARRELKASRSSADAVLFELIGS